MTQKRNQFRFWLASSLSLVLMFTHSGCWLNESVEPFYGEVVVPRAQEFHSDFALAQDARKVLVIRRERLKHLPPELFSEPAWDILLDLFVSQMQQKDISVSSACLSSHVPQTTALRWLDVLTNLGLVERYASPDDKRVCFVRLTSAGRHAMRCHLSTERNLRSSTQAAGVLDLADPETKLIVNG